MVKIFREKRFKTATAREKHFRSLVNFSPQPLILKDKNGQVLFASESIRDLLGLKKNLQPSDKIDNFVHPDDREAQEKFLEEVRKAPFERTYHLSAPED